jgi:HD-GYP domain-containing protein (c-di-GMP phosphodiesterase class II)
MPDQDRWQERKVAAAALRLAALLLPIGAAIATSAVLGRWIPRQTGVPATILRSLVLIAASTLALVLVERVSRRLLPLATLMRLSIVFPDRAPSRFRLARRAGSVRELRRRVEEARANGLAGEPEVAADSVLTLIAALGNHDRRTRGHSERVRAFTDLIGEELGLDADDRDRLRWAALLHDVGKLMISSELLNKVGRPNEDEWAQLHRHPIEGARLAAPLLPWLGEWATAIEHHHERFDGKGYPYGLAGREISLGARIVAVADSYETMTAARSYKRPLSPAAARQELTRCAGTQFDPAIVRVFLNVSIGRLWRRTGPLAWVAQAPFLGWLPRVGEQAVAFAGARVAAGAVAGVTALTVAGAAAPLHPAPHPPVVAGVTVTAPDRSLTPDDLWPPTTLGSDLLDDDDSDGSTTTTRGHLVTTTTTPRSTVSTTNDQPEIQNPVPGATTPTTPPPPTSPTSPPPPTAPPPPLRTRPTL